MMFLDSAGIIGRVGANLRALGHKNLMEIKLWRRLARSQGGLLSRCDVDAHERLDAARCN